MGRNGPNRGVCELRFFGWNPTFHDGFRLAGAVWCGVVCSACLSGLHEVSQHDNGGCVLFPDHLPEVSHRLLQRTLRRDVLLCSLVALSEREVGRDGGDGGGREDGNNYGKAVLLNRPG